MFLLPVWILLTGAALVEIARLRKAGRPLFSAVACLSALSAAVTLVPFIFFSQPRIISYFGGVFSFRVDWLACIAAFSLSVFALGCLVWLAAYCWQPGIERVFSLLLTAIGISTASVFASNWPSMAFLTLLTFLVLVLLQKSSGFKA